MRKYEYNDDRIMDVYNYILRHIDKNRKEEFDRMDLMEMIFFQKTNLLKNHMN